MTRAVIDQAIQPFFTTKASGYGSGLGLSMVYGFVRQSGGYLRINSAPGEGTSVRVFLPRTKDTTNKLAIVDEADIDKLGSGQCILVVDDKPAVRKMIRNILTRRGYAVAEADSGSAALAMLHKGPNVDLLLTDIVLQGKLDGYDLAREAQRRYPQLKVLYMSGYAKNASVRAGSPSYDIGFIVKPFSKDDLARKVRQALGS